MDWSIGKQQDKFKFNNHKITFKEEVDNIKSLRFDTNEKMLILSIMVLP